MKRIAILAAALAVAACNSRDKANTTDTATAGGAVAPSADSSGAMSSGSNMSAAPTTGSSMSDSSHMSGSSMADTTHMRDSSRMTGSKMHDSTHMKGAAQNQSQSGVTDSSGTSTLGKNVKKLTPTSGAAVTAKGDTLKKPSP